jgi:antitoxin FitA
MRAYLLKIENACIDSNTCNDYIASMPSITIRNISPEAHRRLRIRAAQNGHSMQEEALNLIEMCTVAPEISQPESNWADEIVSRMQAVGGVELKLPEYDDGVEPPEFGKES